MSPRFVSAQPTIDSDYRVDSSAAASTWLVEGLPAATRPATSLVSRFGSFMLPLAAAAAFVGPVPHERIRATYARGSRSETSLLDVIWLLDDWTYSEEPAAIEEVRRLNALLALDIAEGLTLELPE